MNESTHIDKPSKAGDIDSEPFSESLNNVKNNDSTFDKLKEHMDINHEEVLEKIKSLQIKCCSCDNKGETKSDEQNHGEIHEHLKFD